MTTHAYNRRAIDVVPEPIAMAIVNLFTSYGKKADRPTVLMYWRTLHDVPAQLLDAAVTRAVRDRDWVAKPSELRRDAEAVRKELRELHGWKKCPACIDTQGFVPTEIDGVTRMVRCICYDTALVILRQLGADGPALLSKPLEAPADELTDVRALAAGSE